MLRHATSLISLSNPGIIACPRMTDATPADAEAGFVGVNGIPGHACGGRKQSGLGREELTAFTREKSTHNNLKRPGRAG